MPTTPPDSRAAAAGVLAAAAVVALSIDAFLIEPVRVEVSSHDLTLPGLPPAWEGARVLHASDLHYGNPRSEWLFKWLVATVSELRPDLVILTGDFVQSSEREAPPCADYLAQIRCPHGIVGVLGDHDYYEKPKRVRPGLDAALTEAGVRLLRNSSAEMPGGLLIAGVDPTTPKLQAGDVGAAISGLGNQRPHLMLAHSPDVLPQAVEHDVPMVLCGHTHGGQVVLPFLGPPLTHTRVSRRHASGWSRMGPTTAYTCRGLSSHWSLRFLCPPEVVLFTLRTM